MKKHIEQKRLSYTPRQMFDLVSAVDRYSEFAPWCVASRINSWEGDDVFYADLVVGYKLFRERFTSKVMLMPPEGGNPGRITIDYLKGPLKQLQNTWVFTADDEGGCIIDFSVEFEFNNSMLQGIAQVFFQEIVRRMVDAFEDRAKQLYD
ncbi:MAG: ubiquinone-binding protein [Micavibrio sp.]|nr:ubiquinone-binding protein [Micavibrio sp.]|tara:strand:- start:2743 stop:3192 length:450 start_codon:yes stop_codon:yes gene_type:complete